MKQQRNSFCKQEVAVMTWYNHGNCGGNLQAYALKTVLNRLGYKAIFINYIPRIITKNLIKKKIRRAVSSLIQTSKNLGFDHFQKKYLPETKLLAKEQLPMLNNRYSLFICGSDQIWAPNVFDSAYFLDFVSTEKKKISYAASIGLPKIPETLVGRYHELISRINYVSVREVSGAQLLKEVCGIDADTVLDPTLLLQKQDYCEIETSVAVMEPYIFCYFLNSHNWYGEVCKKIAEKYGVHIIVYSCDDSNEIVADQWISQISPDRFCYLIHKASGVLTDSFHGTIFSILYHKPFLNLVRFDDTDPICQNSRVYDLLGKLGLSSHMLKKNYQEDELYLKQDVDYSEVDRKIEILRKHSYKYLSSALSEGGK